MEKENKREYFIKYSYPFYFLITRKKLLGLIPYWSTVYYNGDLKNVEEEYKKIINE